jgi:hypothetical protein
MSLFRITAKEDPLHSHDRTHLASLGFADPDKGDPRHDLACQFLAQPSTQARIAGLFPRCRPAFAADCREHRVRVCFEALVVKGEGKYAQTQGYIDLVIPMIRPAYDGHVDYDWTKERWVGREGRPVEERSATVAVEVKIRPRQVGDYLRQLKTYRAFSSHQFWLLATTFDISRNDLVVLEQEQIRHVRLGDAFEAWMAEQASDTTRADSVEF